MPGRGRSLSFSLVPGLVLLCFGGDTLTFFLLLDGTLPLGEWLAQRVLVQLRIAWEGEGPRTAEVGGEVVTTHHYAQRQRVSTCTWMMVLLADCSQVGTTYRQSLARARQAAPRRCHTPAPSSCAPGTSSSDTRCSLPQPTWMTRTGGLTLGPSRATAWPQGLSVKSGRRQRSSRRSRVLHGCQCRRLRRSVQKSHRLHSRQTCSLRAGDAVEAVASDLSWRSPRTGALVPASCMEAR